MEWVFVTKNDANYEIKERSATEVTVQVTVGAPAVKDEIDAIYRRYGREVQIPGFRKGHVPRSFLDSRFGRELFLEEAQKELEEDHLQKAISALELRPVTTPELEVVSFDDGGEFVFTTRFSVLPTIELPEYRGIELAVEPEKPVREEDVQGALDEIRHRFATLSPKEEESVSEGDVVHVKEGEEEWHLRAEAANPVAAKLIGAKVGETVEIDLDLPDGKSKRTVLTILGLKEIVLPELDDDLAKDAGFDSLAALKDNIKERLSQLSAQRRERAIKVKLLDHLVDQTEIPLPEALVEERVNEEVEGLKKEFADRRSSLTFEGYLEKQGKSEEKLRADYYEMVTRHLQRELLLQRIIEKEGITIDDAELEEIARDEATEAQEDPLRFVARLKANERWESYRQEKVNARALDILYNEAKLTEEER